MCGVSEKRRNPHVYWGLGDGGEEEGISSSKCDWYMAISSHFYGYSRVESSRVEREREKESLAGLLHQLKGKKKKMDESNLRGGGGGYRYNKKCGALFYIFIFYSDDSFSICHLSGMNKNCLIDSIEDLRLEGLLLVRHLSP